MSSVKTFSNSGLYNETELVCLLGLRPDFLGLMDDASDEPDTKPHTINLGTIEEYACAISPANQNEWVISREGFDYCINLSNMYTFNKPAWRFNNHFATTLLLRRHNAIISDTTTTPLVNPEDVSDIKANYSALTYGKRTKISKALKKDPGSSHHTMLRAISAAQLLWQESFESNIQDE